MLTEILVHEVGQAINYDIKMIGIEKGEIKKEMLQIDYDNSKANATKTSHEQQSQNQKFLQMSSSKQSKMSIGKNQQMMPT